MKCGRRRYEFQQWIKWRNLSGWKVDVFAVIIWKAVKHMMKRIISNQNGQCCCWNKKVNFRCWVKCKYMLERMIFQHPWMKKDANSCCFPKGKFCANELSGLQQKYQNSVLGHGIPKTQVYVWTKNSVNKYCLSSMELMICDQRISDLLSNGLISKNIHISNRVTFGFYLFPY